MRKSQIQFLASLYDLFAHNDKESIEWAARIVSRASKLPTHDERMRYLIKQMIDRSEHN